MGTFSKALAGGGGFVVGSAEVIDYLRLHARAFMFTAAAPPAVTGAALAGVGIARSCEGDERRLRLAYNARYLRKGIAGIGFDVPSAPCLASGDEVASPIVAVPVADDLVAIRLWNALFDNGVYVNMAVYPAVPRGHAQLRVSAMATHEVIHLDRALDAFSKAHASVLEPALETLTASA
jgi:8-amino-7-oxononanoate synthase